MADRRFLRLGMPVIVFDGDDTLWETEPLYDDARTSAANYVGTLGIDPVAFEATQKRVDVERARSLGLTRNRFPGSSVLAAQELAGQESLHLRKSELRKVSALSSEVFQRTAPTNPDASTVMAQLTDRFQIALLTKGDESVQRKRVADSGLAYLLDFAHIVNDKDEAAFRYVLSRLQASPLESWSVGNSAKSDILPAVGIGMKGILIDAPVWAHESPVSLSDFEGRYWNAAGLMEVPSLIFDGSSA